MGQLLGQAVGLQALCLGFRIDVLLQYRGAVQLGLFDPPPESNEAVRKLKQDVGLQHGRFALRSAATLPLADVYADESHGYEICDIEGKTCF